MADCSEKNKDTILIVDDTPENLKLLNNLLKDHYQVRAANTGERALAIIKSSEPPELILLDIMMPGMDGFAVCKEIKAMAHTRDIPVIFISALNDMDNIVKSFAVGGVDYITKPFHVDEVHARVKTHLELRRAKAEVQLLLSKTLVGSVKFMMDLLELAQPSLVVRSNRLRGYAKDVVAYLKISAQEAWCIELATMLLHIGCVMLPEDIAQKHINGKQMTIEEQQLFEAQIMAGTELIACIPRLDKVADLIRSCHGMTMKTINTNCMDRNAILLKALVEFDRLLLEGVTPLRAINKLTVEIAGCPREIFEALVAISPSPKEEE